MIKKIIKAFPFLILGLLVNPFPAFGQASQGTLNFSPLTVKNGSTFSITLSGGFANTQTKIWVDNNDGKGFRDFGGWITTDVSGNFNVNRTLNCNAYQTLEPNQTVPIGNRKLVQKVYLEYIGLNKTSSIATHTKDCTTTSDTNPTNPTPPPAGTGNSLFPYTVKSIFGTNYIRKAFPSPTQYTSPIKNFAGRYFDGKDRGGSNTSLGFEWYTMNGSSAVEGDTVRTSGNRIYVLLGNTIAAYNKSTFAGRLANNANSTLSVFAGSKESGKTLQESYDHGILPWDAYLYPEHADNGWLFPRVDNHTGLTAFDVDDRGYIYFIDTFGFGIGRDDGGALRLLVQVTDSASAPTPIFKSGRNGTVKVTDMNGYGQPARTYDQVNTVKSAGKYYAVITGTSSFDGKGGTRIIDVTDPNNPLFVRSAGDEVINHLVQSGDTVAVSVGTLERAHGATTPLTPEIKIYSSADFISGGSPKKVFTAGPVLISQKASAAYTGLAADKVSGKFYSVHYGSNPRPSSSIPAYVSPTASISVFSPSNGSYTEKRFELSAESMGGKSGNPGWNGYQYIYYVETLDYDNGYLISRGIHPQGFSDVKIWNTQNAEPKELSTNGFIHSYYSGNKINQAAVQNLGGKDYLFVSTFELADVYELTTNPGGSTTNPNATTTPATTPPDVKALLDQPCATTFAGNSALIGLCQQVKFVQQRSCNLVPGLSFCYGFKEVQ